MPEFALQVWGGKQGLVGWTQRVGEQDTWVISLAVPQTPDPVMTSM